MSALPPITDIRGCGWEILANAPDQSVETNGIGRNANVYAELGSTWRFVMRDPTTAAHLLGKLLKHIGADNVLCGTNSICTAHLRTKFRPSKLSNHSGADGSARVP